MAAPTASWHGSRIWAFVVLVLPLLGACATTDAAPPEQSMKAYRIGPPDQLTITILPDPVIERSVTVRPDGMISIDLVGDIPAAGRTAQEVGADIQQRIGRFKRDANVTVSLAQSLSSEITVLGEVNRPSTFPLTRETRVVEALGQVGGTRPFAAKDRIRVIRLVDGQSKIYRTDLDAIESGDLSTNFQLLGGDVMVVPPTRLAQFGYAMQAVLFPPIEQWLGGVPAGH